MNPHSIWRSRLIEFVVVACAASVSLAGADTKESKPTRPNILVILGDDMGYADIGVQGCRDIPTPHIDSLAKNGVQCRSGYVSGPYCSPTRAGLMTGRYQQRFGHEFNPGPPTDTNIDVGLSLQETTIADRLKAAGYTTGMIGKWHLGHAEKFHPLNRGFQEYFGFLGGAHSYLTAGRSILCDREPVPEPNYLTDAFAREALAFLDQQAATGKPFFLYLAFNAVHTPMHATDKYLQRFANIEDKGRRTYAAMMSAMDDAIGQVLDKLRQQKQDENTLIFFFSDNGGPTNANHSSNQPLRGQKATTWEGGVRVPYLVQWNGRLPAGKVYDQPVIQLDILPTALAAAGIAVSPDWKLDGVNLLPYFSGEKSGAPHEALYWRFGAQMAIRHGDWKLVKARGADVARGTRRAGALTLEGAMLFDLAKDIGEQNDCAGSNSDKVKELTTLWNAWNGELKDPQWKVARSADTKNAKKKKKQN